MRPLRQASHLTAGWYVAGGTAAVDADQKLSLEGAPASNDSYFVFDSNNSRIRFYVNGFEVARLKE